MTLSSTSYPSFPSDAGDDVKYGHCDASTSDARFYNPRGVCYNAVDKCVYVADSSNHCIRRLDPLGCVSTIAGFSLCPGHVDGSIADAKFDHPCSVSAAADGSLYVAEFGSHAIRLISADQTHVSTVAGKPGEAGFSNGTGRETRFRHPMNIVVADSVGFVFISDYGNHSIRRLCMRTHTVDTIAGDGFPGFSVKNEVGQNARFYFPHGLAWNAEGNDGNGSLYVADTGNNCVRKLRFCGGAGYYEVSQVAGSGFSGFADGPALEARFEAPVALAYHAGSLYISDEISGDLRVLGGMAPTSLGFTRRNFVYTVARRGTVLAGFGQAGCSLSGGVTVVPHPDVGLIVTGGHCIQKFGYFPDIVVNFATGFYDGIRGGRPRDFSARLVAFDTTSSNESSHTDSTDAENDDSKSEVSADTPVAGNWQSKQIELLESEVDMLKRGFIKMMNEIESLKDENRKIRCQMNEKPTQ